MRRRIRDLKESAHQTMVQAQATLAQAQQTLSHADKAALEVSAKAMETLELICDIAEAVMDGKAKLNLQIAGNDWPIGARLDFDDDQADPPADK
jgi:hypothetical protein